MKYIRQLSADAPLYEQQDTCVICGRYLPEGSCVVCQDFMATVYGKYAAYQLQAENK